MREIYDRERAEDIVTLGSNKARKACSWVARNKSKVMCQVTYDRSQGSLVTPLLFGIGYLHRSPMDGLDALVRVEVSWMLLKSHTPFSECSADLDLSSDELAPKDQGRYDPKMRSMRQADEREHAKGIAAFRYKKARQSRCWVSRNKGKVGEIKVGAKN